MKLRIEKPIYGGAGLARIPEDEPGLAGKAVFVPFTLPGETIEAKLVDDRGSFAKAELVSILEPAIGRTTPPCPYFGFCGGCQYQHAVYAHQVEMKVAILRETLDRARIQDVPPIHTMQAKPWQYRNRIRLLIEREPFALCYRRRASHAPLAVQECPIAAPLLQKALLVVTKIGPEHKLADLAQEIEFFTDAAEGSLLVTLNSSRRLRSDERSLFRLCEALQVEMPRFAGAASFFSPNPKAPAAKTFQWGADHLNYQVGDHSYRVGIASFFQVNRYLVEPLRDLVSQNQSGELAWDLYAGAGLFSRALAPNFKAIVAVESAPGSHADLIANLRSLPRARTVRSTTLDFLRRVAPFKDPPPELVVVDPPRAGLGPEVAKLLSQIGPAKIVYVSCDPATLARDLKSLLDSGYKLKTMTLVDMFPQTFHLESVSVLARV